MADSFIRDALREVDELTPGSPRVALPEPAKKRVAWPLGAISFDERNQQFVFDGDLRMDRAAWEARRG